MKHNKLTSLFRALALTFFAALLFATAFAQQGRGTILGSVTDPTGAVVPGAQVVITNINTNLEFTATSNNDGAFKIFSTGASDLVIDVSGFFAP